MSTRGIFFVIVWKEIDSDQMHCVGKDSNQAAT